MNYNKKLQLIKKIFIQKKSKNKKFTYPLLTDGYSSSDLQEASKVLLNGRLTMSNITKKFEKYFAKKIGSKYALMVNSGSSANLLALFCLIKAKVLLISSSTENFFDTNPSLISLIVLNCI